MFTFSAKYSKSGRPFENNTLKMIHLAHMFIASAQRLKMLQRRLRKRCTTFDHAMRPADWLLWRASALKGTIQWWKYCFQKRNTDHAIEYV